MITKYKKFVKSSVDKSNMRQVILDFPKQFRAGAKSAQRTHLEPGTFKYVPENIIICGMGGSGLPGDILANIKPLNVFSHKTYGLPLQAKSSSLIICISYSGNTEETLSAFSEALNRKMPVITITTGGKLEKLSQKYNIPCVKLPLSSIPPRLALGQMFSALLQVLVNHNLLGAPTMEELLKISDSLKSERLEAQGKTLAKKIFHKIPIVYTSERSQEIGLIWKNSLNETAKILALTNFFPELNHNETVGFWKINEMQISNNKLFVIILRDKQSHPRILKQMNITKDLISKEKIQVQFVEVKGKTKLEKIFSTIVLGFWTSYHLALLYKVDPTQIKIIEEFKKRLAGKDNTRLRKGLDISK